MLSLLLAAHAISCVAILGLAKPTGVSLGSIAALAAALASGFAVVLGSVVRVWVAPLVLLLGCVAAARTLKMADTSSIDDDHERLLNKAGMALVALAIGEALILLVGGFVWAAN